MILNQAIKSWYKSSNKNWKNHVILELCVMCTTHLISIIKGFHIAYTVLMQKVEYLWQHKLSWFNCKSHNCQNTVSSKVWSGIKWKLHLNSIKYEGMLTMSIVIEHIFDSWNRYIIIIAIGFQHYMHVCHECLWNY